MQVRDPKQLKEDILKNRMLVLRLEITLYAMPDDFLVYVDEGTLPITRPYRATRNRRAYEYSDESRKRYERLIGHTEMYNILKRHLSYEKDLLKKLESDYGKPIQFKDKKLTNWTQILEDLQRPRGPKTLLELQPRSTRRSDSEEDLYEEALSLVARTQIADVTLIRDNLSIGHTQAERLMCRLEDAGLVSRLDGGAHKRTVFVTIDDIDTNKVRNNAAE